MKECWESAVDDNKHIKETPFDEENKKILGEKDIKNYEEVFHQIYLELLDYAKAFNASKEQFTNALLNSGARENPQEIYGFIDDLSSRLEKIHIVKRLCSVLGLQGEMDRIIEAEIELIYKSPRVRRSSQVSYGDMIAGDRRNDK